jgi:mRNA-degrading endonuclease RelE of RelBE toxin-antitoxin system
MKATFIELPPFERLRESYLDDRAYKELQNELMKNPEAGDVITGAGGLRKLRFGDEKRGKGKRGGLRIIYFWKDTNDQFWLFTIYDKNENDDLSPVERKALRDRLKAEIEARSKHEKT